MLTHPTEPAISGPSRATDEGPSGALAFACGPTQSAGSRAQQNRARSGPSDARSSLRATRLPGQAKLNVDEAARDGALSDAREPERLVEHERWRVCRGSSDPNRAPIGERNRVPSQGTADATTHARWRHDESSDHQLATVLQAEQADHRTPLLRDP